MVTSIEDLAAVRAALDKEKLPLPPLGAMIEIPSALLQLKELADESDFLSVGTNDLTQHLLGVDRTNARVTRYFDTCHPSVVRALFRIAEAARTAGKPFGVCGEAASDPLLLPLWLGLGVARLSVHAPQVRILRAIEARLDADAAARAVERALDQRTAADVRACFEELAEPQVREAIAARLSG
jgi:phosphoenolpyruvate-protein kinase (PTS system EI component)